MKDRYDVWDDTPRYDGNAVEQAQQLASDAKMSLKFCLACFLGVLLRFAGG